MSESQQRHGLSELPAWRRLLLTGGVALALVMGQGGAVTAQDASPVATECDAPELPPGTPTPMMEGSPEAMPEMEEGMGTPEASAAGDAELPEGTAADDATAAEIMAAVENYVACYQSGDFAAVHALETENYLLENYGSANPYDAIASDESEGAPFTVQLVSISNPMTYEDGRVSADVEIILNDHWFWHIRQFYADGGDYWLLDQEITLKPEPEGDTAVVGVALGSPDNEYSLVPNTSSVLENEVIIFHAVNGGAELHELIVAQLPEGADPMGLLDGSVAFEDVKFIGAVWDIAPGEEADLALVNLPPGTYHLLCFYPTPEGVPHLAEGMVAVFTVNPLTT